MSSKKSKNNLELKTVSDIIRYMGEDDALLIRNLDGEIARHWIENYSKMKNKKPEIIEINEDLYLNCLSSNYFVSDNSIKDSEKEFYLRCYKFF